MKYSWIKEGWGNRPSVVVKGAKCPMCEGVVVSLGVSAWRCTTEPDKYHNIMTLKVAGKDYHTHAYYQLDTYEPENEFGPVSP